jgi:hypothetical protein
MDITIEEYAREIVDIINRDHGDEVEAVYTTITKANDEKFHGMMIRSREDLDKSQSISPTLYVNEPYENEIDTEEAAQGLYDVYLENISPNINFDMEQIMDFDNIKDKIHARLLNPEKNKEYLKDMVSVPFLDMACIFAITVGNIGKSVGTIAIRKGMLEKWNKTPEDLIECVINDKFNIIPMGTLLKNMLGEAPIEDDAPQMFVITNEDRVYGASALMSNNTLKEVAGIMKSDLYLLPSSVHEIIAVPSNGTMDIDNLKAMVREVNDTQLSANELLSYNVYEYDKEENEVRISA